MGMIMTDRREIYDAVATQIAPFNKKGIALSEATTFQGDLEWDSLTVMDFVAEVEDSFDIVISMNLQAEIENVGHIGNAPQYLSHPRLRVGLTGISSTIGFRVLQPPVIGRCFGPFAVEFAGHQATI